MNKGAHPKKKDFMPKQAINADAILAGMLKARHFHEANERFRRDVRLKQNTHNLINKRDSLLWHVQNTTTPALRDRLRKDLYNIGEKLDDNFFKMHVLGKRDI